MIPPVGESRPNHEVFAELCRRTGVARPGDPETAAEIDGRDLPVEPSRRGRPARGARRATASPSRESEGPRPVRGRVPAHGRPEGPPRSRGSRPRGARSGSTGSGRSPPRRRFRSPSISPATDRTISSTLGELHAARVPLEMHPADAAARGIADGGAGARLQRQRRGALPRRVSDAGLRPGVVFLPKGLWSHNTDNGATAIGPRARHADGPRRRRLLQRRAGRSRAGLEAVELARRTPHAQDRRAPSARGATGSTGGGGCGRRSCSRPAFLLLEVAGGLVSRSLALLADAAHMFADIAALTLAYAAMGLADRAPTGRHSFGFYRAEILAAFVNAQLLLVIAGWMLVRGGRPVAGAGRRSQRASCSASPSRRSAANFVAMRLLSQRPRTRASTCGPRTWRS